MTFFFIVFSFSADLVNIPIQLNIFDFVLGFFSGLVTFFLSIIISKSLKIFIKKEFVARSEVKNFLTLSPFRLAVFLAVSYIFIYSIAEEIIFRSIILVYLVNKYDAVYAILISSICFSLIHFNSKFIQLFVMGLIYSIIVLLSHNLFTSITAHIVNNSLALGFYSYKINKQRRKNLE